MTPTVIITIGISASGKTTFAKEECKRTGAIRINRDDMRSSLFGYTLQEYFNTFSEHNDKEQLITSLTWKMANDALKQGKDVILDNTHLDLKYINAILNNIDEECKFEIKWFFIDPEIAIERDSKREVIIGEKTIWKQYDKFLKLWNQKDSIDVLVEQRKQLNFKPVVQNESLPEAIVFDIDGTLALMGENRGPYDWDKVDEDSINKVVYELLSFVHSSNWIDDFYGYDCDPVTKLNIIICTGRDGKAESKTKEWLKKYYITYDDFYILKSGDNRKDSIVKREFLEDIITKYNILFTLDDRDQVCKMWRKSGIPCFQVAKGDF